MTCQEWFFGRVRSSAGRVPKPVLTAGRDICGAGAGFVGALSILGGLGIVVAGGLTAIEGRSR